MRHQPVWDFACELTEKPETQEEDPGALRSYIDKFAIDAISATVMDCGSDKMDTQGLDVTKVTSALAPAFAAGFAVQQAIEVVDTVLAVFSEWWRGLAGNTALKKLIAMLIGLLLAIVLVLGGNFDVIKPLLTAGNSVPGFVSRLITVIFISGGTEGFNSLIKWITWKKEEAKSQAAGAPSTARAAMTHAPIRAASYRLDT